MLELTDSILELVLFLAGSADVVLVFQTTIDHALSSLQFEVRHALSADASVVLHAAILILLAGTRLGDVEAAFTSIATKVIVLLAVLDHAPVVVEFEGSKALGTAMVR